MTAGSVKDKQSRGVQQTKAERQIKLQKYRKCLIRSCKNQLVKQLMKVDWLQKYTKEKAYKENLSFWNIWRKEFYKFSIL